MVNKFHQDYNSKSSIFFIQFYWQSHFHNYRLQLQKSQSWQYVQYFCYLYSLTFCLALLWCSSHVASLLFMKIKSELFQFLHRTTYTFPVCHLKVSLILSNIQILAFFHFEEQILNTKLQCLTTNCKTMAALFFMYINIQKHIHKWEEQ